MKIFGRNLLAFLLVFSMIISIGIPTSYAAFGLPDGGKNEGGGRKTLELLNFNDMSSITLNNLVADNQYTKDGKYSAYWNHNDKTNVDMKKIPVGDWSDYFEINLSIYGKNAGGTQFVIVAFCETGGYFYTTVTVEEGQHDYAISFGNMSTSGNPTWDKISYVRITSSGWAMTPSYDSEYWFNGMKLRAVEEGVARIYPVDDVDSTYAAMQNNVGMYAGGSSILCGNKVEHYKTIEWTEETTAVPVDIFAKYLGAKMTGNADKATISANDKSISLTADSKSYSAGQASGELSIAPYKKDGLMYVPGAQVAELLGYQVKTDGKLLIIGDEKVRLFDSNSKVSNMREIVGYLTYANDIDPASIPDEEIELAKDRWRYQIVGDENIDLTDPAIQNIVAEISKRGKSAWDLMDASRDDSLFLGKMPELSHNMTSEYKYILYMAQAWAQYGSEYYHNEELLSAVLYALEFQFENRYGYDEIENDPDKVWRDNTLTNWYDWQIDTPRVLMDILMLVEDYLTQQQKEDYCAFFDYWVYERTYNSLKVNGGMNVLYTVKSWIASMLLQGDREGLLDAVSTLHNCFAWADTFQTREGYFSDGSYVFHYKHPMTGQYGITQFELSGPILSCIAGTSFDFTNPRRENIFDWIYDAYEPIIFDGAIFRFVKGRDVNSSDHNIGRRFIQGVLNLLDFAGEEDKARMKSLIKYYVQTEKIVSYTDSNLSVPQRMQIKEILEDESIKPRDDYYISKTYYNMDKISHQRKKWAFGISMSSNRIYDYECIHGANPTGWYTSDGMTQLMLANDQGQFNTGYWNNIDPYKYPGITADTQERASHIIDTGNAFVKDFDFVGGATLGGEYTTAAQHLNAFHLDEDEVQGGGNVIKAHKSTLVAKKSWFLFDDEVVCLGAGINANDGFDVRTIVENRKSNNMQSTIPEDQITEEYEVVSLEASQIPQADNIPENTLDKDFGSKWAAEGEANIVYDIGEVKPIGMVGFAFQSGSSRTQAIDILLSEDGKNWTQMFTGNSSGKTEGIEIFDMKNTPARYVRLNSYGNSAGGLWISLTETSIYGPYEGDKPEVVAGSWLGAEKVNVNGTDIVLTEDETVRSDVNWVNLETVGGYYFPQGGNVTMRRSTGEKSFFEMWLNHGVSPKEQGYAYVLLPTMSPEETSAYAKNPGIEILSNTDKISAVYDKSSGTTGVVFWEAGTFDGITVDKPMIITYQRTEEGLNLVASDPTHKLTEATITTNEYIDIENADYRMTLLEDGKSIKLALASSQGAGLEGKFKKVSAPSVVKTSTDKK